MTGIRPHLLRCWNCSRIFRGLGYGTFKRRLRIFTEMSQFSLSPTLGELAFYKQMRLIAIVAHNV